MGSSNLAEATLGPENSLIQSSSLDSIFVCEKFSEASQEIPNTLACFVRFYETFASKHTMFVWIAQDALNDLEIAKKYLHPPRDWFGEWSYGQFTKLAREIQLTSNRTFIIRQSWLPKLEELLLN